MIDTNEGEGKGEGEIIIIKWVKKTTIEKNKILLYKESIQFGFKIPSLFNNRVDSIWFGLTGQWNQSWTKQHKNRPKPVSSQFGSIYPNQLKPLPSRLELVETFLISSLNLFAYLTVFFKQAFTFTTQDFHFLGQHRIYRRVFKDLP